MGWIVLTVLLGIVFWAGIAIWLYGRGVKAEYEAAAAAGSAPTDRYGNRQQLTPLSLIGKLTAGGAALLWVAGSLNLMFHTVGQREVAIVYNFSGTIAGKKDPGVVTVWPWQHVKKENVGILHDEWTFDSNNAAVSKDQQKITAALSVNYQIDPAKVVDLYTRVGASWKSIIIDARVPQVFKETTAKYVTPDLTAKRDQLRIDTKNRLEQELGQYDIKVVDVFVRNLGFPKSYTDAIDAKQKQTQDALRAQAKVAEVEAQARQKVAEAEGAAKSNVARARGEATANRLRNQSLTARLVQLAAIEKLNPNVQVIICPPQSVCIPNSGVIPNPGGTP